MTDALVTSILDALNSRIAVIDSDGVIRLVNQAWTRFARENGDPDEATTGVGVDYLMTTARSAAHGDESAAKALHGIRAVLSGERAHYELRYPCHSATEQKWFLMRVTAISVGGAVIAHIDITAQRLAARSRAREERQHMRETESLENMAFAPSEHSSQPLDSEQGWEQRYHALLEQALEQRALKVDLDISAELRAFAAALGRQSASPRDLIRIHARVIAQKKAAAPTPLRLKASIEEGRLLLIELMGYLAAYYRDMMLAAVELQNM